jgi:hypothetical protein
MSKKRDTVRYTAEEVAALRARGEDKTDWARVNAKTETELAADTASDPAWDGIDEEWVTSARVANDLLARPKRKQAAGHDPFRRRRA